MTADDVVVDLLARPGHLLRRAQQVHTDAWARLGPVVTGPQYAVLVTVEGWADVDQKMAGELASLDKSTMAGVVSRLVHGGWLHRVPDARDRRRRLLHLTTRARTELPAITSAARRVQDELLSALARNDRSRFTAQLARVARVGELRVHVRRTPVVGLALVNTPGYLLRRAQQAHASHWASSVPDVTGPQYAVLSAVSRHLVSTHAQIGVIASLDSSTTLDVVRRLTARGWLESLSDSRDRRSRPVRLTEPATNALRFTRPAVVAVQAEILRPLHPGEHTDFVLGLRRVAGVAGVVAASPIGSPSALEVNG